MNKDDSVTDFSLYCWSQIEGNFSITDMEILKAEVAKLKAGDVYLEIGVNQGLSFATAFNYSAEGVYVIGVDIIDVLPFHHSQDTTSVGRARFMEDNGMVGIKRRGFYIHGDADIFAPLFCGNIDVLFIDGGHDYESIKLNTERWEGKVKPGGVILYHDYDHPDVKRWLDERYGDNKELLNNKIIRVYP